MRVVILGANGALGQAVEKKFMSADCKALLCDVQARTGGMTPFHKLDANISPKDQYSALDFAVQREFGEGCKLDAIINVGGGFKMANAASEDIFENLRLMHSSSVESSIIAAHLAAMHLKEGGLLVLPGAAAAAKATPWAVAYGAAKAAVHHLVRSLSAGGGLPAGTTVVGIAPVMLDTPANRASMPEADVSTWTPLDHVAERLYEWADKKDIVKSGCVYKIVTASGKTEFSAI
jgi:dihydropteridine reductase